MTVIPNKKFELPLGFLIGFLCMPTGWFAMLDLSLRLTAKLGHAPKGPTPLLAAIALDLIILNLVGIIPFLAACGLWLVLLVAGRSRGAKSVTFICLLFAIAGIAAVRSMGPQ